MILDRYFARRFLVAFVATGMVFLILLALLDLVDKLRDYGDAGIPFGQILGLTALSLPAAIYRVLPLVMILATVALFLALARSSELVVTRAAGRSALRALLAPVMVGLVIGILAVLVLNPIVAGSSKELEVRTARIDAGGGSATLVSGGALWLRQGSEAGQTVIRATRANLEGTELEGVTFVTFAPEGGPVSRIEARSARLTPGAWVLEDAKVWPLKNTPNPEAAATRHDSLEVPSTLTADQIRDSFGTPSSIPIWDLPRFIEELRAAGFSARRHAVWFQVELSQPLFLVAMVLIGAAFTMRHQRGGRTGLMVLMAVILAFALYFLRNFAQILGESGQLPIPLAAWAPPAAGFLLALGMILHLEDG